jgi:hypothetical protein
MREVVTVQVGGFANFVGSHFWNFQVISLVDRFPGRSFLPRVLALSVLELDDASAIYLLVPLRRMSCSGSPTTPAPTRYSGPPRWTWTSCTAPARHTR